MMIQQTILAQIIGILAISFWAISIQEKEQYKILFLQAWNEWGEGCYVEPDIKYGHAYLDAIKNVIVNNN